MMPGLDLNHLAVTLVAVASIISLFLLLLKTLAKEFESVALLWIRVLRRIKEEKNKVKPNEIPYRQPRASIESHPKRGVKVLVRRSIL